MVVLFNAFCLFQVARKDVGDTKPRQQIRDRLPHRARGRAWNGQRRSFSFAAFKNHIAIFPPVKGDRKLQTDLRPYRGEKGNLKFLLSEPIPYELIGRVASALSRERSI